MTDPRIIECAKALKLKAREIGLSVALTTDQATDLARAAVAQWLSQVPSNAMLDHGAFHCIRNANAVTKSDLSQASAVYAAMRIQAMKEMAQ